MINGVSSVPSYSFQVPESQVERPEGFQGSSKDTFVRDDSKELEKEKSFREMGEMFMAKKKLNFNNPETVFDPVGSFCVTKEMCMGIQRYIIALLMGNECKFFYTLIHCCFCQFFIVSAYTAVKQEAFSIRRTAMYLFYILSEQGNCSWEEIGCPKLFSFTI